MTFHQFSQSQGLYTHRFLNMIHAESAGMQELKK